ncbi:MAG TPA: bidirectional hydrogenase complex protein HoxU [Desulfuromonadaceae bacterium]|jgi:bidirectional [NiFe] hydrogenase diaphorase subunit
MSRIKLTIDQQAATAQPGDTILQAAQNRNISIPTLCNLEGLIPWGGCRVCLVIVVGRPRPVPACATTAEDGMEVITDSPSLRSARQRIVELIFAERNHLCPVCVMNNHCELQSLAKDLQVDHVRYAFLAPAMGIDLSQQRFGIDHNRCILCRRCVRVCDEVEGAHTWDVSGRGAASRVITDLAQPWGSSSTCTDCGKCVQACPTGALFEKGIVAQRKTSISLQRLVAWRRRKDR